MHYFVLTKV